MQHKDLQKNEWFRFSIEEQMAHIGSEIFRSLKWREKGNEPFAQNANYRALELFDLTLSDVRHGNGLKEIARARELWLDFFLGSNQYKQTAKLWEKYFYAFTYAARNTK